MDFTQYVLLGTVIAGLNELLKRLRQKDYWSAVTIALSAVIGLIFGVMGIENLTPELGLAAGIGIVGTFSLADRLQKPSRTLVVNNHGEITNKADL